MPAATTIRKRPRRKAQRPSRSGRAVCGADAEATITREDFGVAFGKNFGFDMGVTLRISVEALAAS